MSTIYRAEKQTDPNKAPGQIVNRPPQAMYLRDVIARIEVQEVKFEDGCCHKTVIARCEGCPYGTINS